MFEASLLAALGVFCGTGNLEGGSGGLTGGLQIAGFSVDLVLVKPSESPSLLAAVVLGRGFLPWKDGTLVT